MGRGDEKEGTKGRVTYSGGRWVTRSDFRSSVRVVDGEEV